MDLAHLRAFADAVADKGAPLPNCWGFIDGTMMTICRPQEHQRGVHSGHKRTHCLKFQGIQAPNGLIVSLLGPYIGRRHDAGILYESGIMPHPQQQVDGNGNPFYVYGDKAYPLSPQVIAPFRGANITPEQQHFNTSMCPLRQSVEWGFGDVTRTFAFLDFKKNMKLYIQPVGVLFKVTTLLVNCRTCLYENQTCIYFGLHPPTIQEYLT